MLEIDLDDYPEVRHAIETQRPVVVDDIEYGSAGAGRSRAPYVGRATVRCW